MRKARLPENTFDITMRPKDSLQLELEAAFERYKIDSDEYFKVLSWKNNYCFRLINYELGYCILEKEPSEATLYYFKGKHIRVFYMTRIEDFNHIIKDLLNRREEQRQWRAERNMKTK